jgi:SAM-dependent methyltransferase
MSDGYFETRLRFDRSRQAVWRHLTRYLAPLVPAEAAVLELGAGYCYFINQIGAARRVALDRWPGVREAAGAGVEPVCSDAVEFLHGADAAQFDVVMASNFLEHFDWPTLEGLRTDLLRVLRPGGRLILIQPNFRLAPGRYFDDYTHRAVFTDVSLADWLEAGGFRVTRRVPRFLPLTVKSRLGRFAFLTPLYLRLPIRPFAGQMLVVADKPR